MTTDKRPDWCGSERRRVNADARGGSGATAAPARVLIVDDDPISTTLLQTMLEAGGLRAITAHSGSAGRRLARKHKPDVVIMDINMPGEDGIEACRKLKKDPSTQAIPVIFVTIVQDVSAKVCGFRVGGSDYITKPYEPDEVRARVNLQISLRQSEKVVALQTAALDEASELIAIVDADCKILVANKSCETETGYPKEALIGRDISFLSAEGLPPDVYNQLRKAVVSEQKWEGEMQMHRHDGSVYILDVTATSFTDPNMGMSFAIVVARDVTDRRMHQCDLEQQARHDFLTGLMNRKGLVEVLSNFASQRHHSEDELALLYVDLDKFKLVNDTLGHSVGDALLVQAASRIKSCVRDGDLAARVGGDEFAILLKGREIADRAETIAKRIIASLDAPFNVYDHELAVSASIGISSGVGVDWDTDMLIRNADTAMYAAKQSGRNQYISYADDESAEVVAIAELKRDLLLAVRRSEFEVYYQPIVEALTMRAVGAEALLRWNHPIRGLVSPGVFIPIAEEIGLMNEIGDYVLREACAAASKWRLLTPITLSANVSEHQLADPGFPKRVESILAEVGLDPASLCLELGERETATGVDSTAVQELSQAGVSVAWDQGGTGQLFPEWLKESRAAVLKIRGALIRKALEDPDERSHLEAIIETAHRLEVKVTAEWVETQDQMELVRSIGFDFAQGHAICSPLKYPALVEFLEDHSEPNLRNAA